ncbi:hypothetical protein ACIQ34_06460 [Ureibacillus sp. NPDC094379]
MSSLKKALIMGIVAGSVTFLIDIFGVENIIAKIIIYFIFYYITYSIMEKVYKSKENA